MILAVAGGKGGVEKTELAYNVAAELDGVVVDAELATLRTELPSFIEGRAADVEIDGERGGVIGEPPRCSSNTTWRCRSPPSSSTLTRCGRRRGGWTGRSDGIVPGRPRSSATSRGRLEPLGSASTEQHVATNTVGVDYRGESSGSRSTV